MFIMFDTRSYIILHHYILLAYHCKLIFNHTFTHRCELDKTTCLQPNITLEHGGLCNDQPESDMAV